MASGGGLEPLLDTLKAAARKAGPALAVYLVLLAAYFIFPERRQLIATILFYALLGGAFNIFMGMTGYVDFGYVAFLAMGAYGMAIAFTYMADLGYWAIPVGFAIGAILASILAGIVGGIALRLRGAYFAIATIGVNEGIRFLIEGGNLLGGSVGLLFAGKIKEALGDDGFKMITSTGSDLILFGLAFLTVAVTALILSTRVGFALQAIREDEDAAKALGINVTKYKLIAFTTSAVLASLLGATFWSLKGNYVEPARVFNIHYTVEAIIVVMLGGAGTLLGPLVGAVIYQGFNFALNTYVAPFLRELGIHALGIHLPIFALILLAVIVAMPEGIVGYLRARVRSRVLREVLA